METPTADTSRVADPNDSLDVWRALATLPRGLREIGFVLQVPAATVRFRLALAPPSPAVARRSNRPITQ